MTCEQLGTAKLMNDLFEETPAAQAWADSVISSHSTGIFGELVPAIIWTDVSDDDGNLLVPLDPSVLVAKINSNPLSLLHNHDPGKPKGQTILSASFETQDGKKFVAAILGYYAGGDVLSFQRMGVDINAIVQPPATLPVLPDSAWIEVGIDPREVDEAWLDLITGDAPIRIKRTELSHNASESISELILIAVPILVIVWSPFSTTIAEEAAKDVYAGIKSWMRKLFERLSERRNPILEIQSMHDGCGISFLLRGKNINQHYAAHDAFSDAAVQAAQLVTNLKARGLPSKKLVYEFDKEALKWFPSFAILNDDRIITDNTGLIAIEMLPKELSLGISRGKLSPGVRPAPNDDAQ